MHKLFVNNLIYSSQTQFPIRTASPAVIYIGLNVGMVLFYSYHVWKIFQMHRGDMQLRRAGSGPIQIRTEPRQHLELMELKQRKHTNIDPPSTSLETQVYTPVPRSPPPAEVESTSHTAALPIISEHEGSDGVAVTKLVFTENPLADTGGGTFSADPPSPSSSKGGLSDSIADERTLQPHRSGSETPL